MNVKTKLKLKPIIDILMIYTVKNVTTGNDAIVPPVKDVKSN